MAKFEALFEDEDNIFGGTPESKYHDIATQGNEEIVKDEFDKIVQKFANLSHSRSLISQLPYTLFLGSTPLV